MIVAIQAVLIIALELGLQSWLWVAGVPLAFGLASGASGVRATGRGAAAGGLAWLGTALYFYLTSAGTISGRMAAMLGLGPGRGWLLVPLAGLLGALVAGLAAFTGASLRVIKKNRESPRRNQAGDRRP
jgi:hypothetical protein